MKELFNKLTKRIIVCTNCGKRTRVPIKMGKTLLITCPNCQHKFEIQFEHPKEQFKATFNKLKQPGSLNNYMKDPQLKRFMPYILAILILIMFKGCFVTPVPTSNQIDSKSRHFNKKIFLV